MLTLVLTDFWVKVGYFKPLHLLTGVYFT